MRPADFVPPPEDDPVYDQALWRYMDLGKFVSLLQSAQLVFPRADVLGDRFEGSLSTPTIENRRGNWPGSAEDLLDIRARARQLVKWTYISCWHASEHESYAMWGLYGSPTGSVAVKSTVRRVGRSAQGLSERLSWNAVSYRDYRKDEIPPANTYWPFLCKRHSFEHEQEVRFIIQRIPAVLPALDEAPAETEKVLPVDVDLHDLIVSVHVSPEAPAYFEQAVKALCDRFELGADVVRSDLAEDPIF